MFTGSAAGADVPPREDGHPDPEEMFADVFEEVILVMLAWFFIVWNVSFQLLRPEVERHTPWWSYVGTVCGGGVGFIVANVPGLMVGAYAGNRLGAVRDAKGKSVAAVFADLGGNQKAEARRMCMPGFRAATETFDRFCVL
jgi:hypothetical protein